VFWVPTVLFVTLSYFSEVLHHCNKLSSFLLIYSVILVIRYLAAWGKISETLVFMYLPKEEVGWLSSETFLTIYYTGSQSKQPGNIFLWVFIQCLPVCAAVTYFWNYAVFIPNLCSVSIRKFSSTYRVFFNEIDAFTGTRALFAVEHMRILRMTQHADNIWNEGKFLPLFTDHKRCWNRCPSTRKYLSQLIVSLKNTHTTVLALTARQTQTFTGWLQ
jgi:hypothetical protein